MADANKDAEHKTEETQEPKSPTEKDDEKQPGDKVALIMKATGNAPIMKKNRWLVPRDRKMGPIIEFMKKLLKLKDGDSLFLYVNQSFAPSPDQTIENLYSCFGGDGTLVINYCLSQAWG